MKRMNTGLFQRCLAFLSALFLLVAGCGGANSTAPPSTPLATCAPSSKSEFAYVLTGYAVSMFTVDSCKGTFTAMTPVSVATGYAFPQNVNAEQMVVDPSGRFAYVANLVSNVSDEATISMYTIDPGTGVLTATAPATVPTGFYPQGIAIDPSGRFVYTANSDDNSVSMFTINQTTGILTPTTPATVPAGSSPGFVTIDPSGRFAYVSDQDDDTISMYNINPTTGVLTPMTPATVPSGPDPFGVAIDPSGKFAYVPAPYSTDNRVSEYTIDLVTGVLTQTQAVALAGQSPTAVAIDPTSKFAYVTNRQANTVSMYTIDSATGNLTLNATVAHPAGSIATGNEPFRINFDPGGKFLYVTNEGSAASVYTVNSDGTLTSLGTTGVGGVSTAIAVLH